MLPSLIHVLFLSLFFTHSTLSFSVDFSFSLWRFSTFPFFILFLFHILFSFLHLRLSSLSVVFFPFFLHSPVSSSPFPPLSSVSYSSFTYFYCFLCRPSSLNFISSFIFSSSTHFTSSLLSPFFFFLHYFTSPSCHFLIPLSLLSLISVFPGSYLCYISPPFIFSLLVTHFTRLTRHQCRSPHSLH